MTRKIEQVRFAADAPKKKRVAAYCRVSSGKDAMLHSLSAQISYYSDYIQKHGWEYAGVYADEALTGTKDNRENFQRLLAECRKGTVQMVITKSISRFARNTVTLLETVRELKALGVDVFFEEQNIHTMSADGELMLTILASYAQEESLSVSENMKWRIRKNFENGKPWSGFILGYRFQNGQFVLVPEEAEIVKRIFREYLGGMGATAIMKGLNEDGILTRTGKPWRTEGVLKILRNYNYTGNLILQKTYRENHLTKRKMKNNGEKPQYHAVGTHEAIIDLATFEAVQEELAKRAEHYSGKKMTVATYPFTGLIVCDGCGKHYRRKTTATGIVWICSTYNTHGKKACADSKAIPESVLYDLTADTPIGDLTAIKAEKDNTLVFCFKNGERTVKRWKDRSRSESWTEDMKEKARQQALAQHSKK
ncbi:MAG: recombinase family protein [Clostridia bacterium]|nr:recombinase family protein [Clostridia bacterium]